MYTAATVNSLVTLFFMKNFKLIYLPSFVQLTCKLTKLRTQFYFSPLPFIVSNYQETSFTIKKMWFLFLSLFLLLTSINTSIKKKMCLLNILTKLALQDLHHQKTFKAFSKTVFSKYDSTKFYYKIPAELHVKEASSDSIWNLDIAEKVKQETSIKFLM